MGNARYFVLFDTTDDVHPPFNSPYINAFTQILENAVNKVIENLSTNSFFVGPYIHFSNGKIKYYKI